MRDRGTSWAARARRIIAAAGLISVATGALLLVAPAPRPSAATAGPARSSMARASSVTVQGPHLWDPAHKKLLTQRSAVTVSQTADLVAQEVHVSWTGFTPSAQPQYDAQSALYSVMIAECKGTRPTQWKDCYMAGQGAQPDIQGPYGPSNAAFVTTSAAGKGQADVAIETSVQNSLLGCTQSAPCSLAIIPGQGGNGLDSPPKCTDHSLDQTLAAPNYTFNSSYGGCSWKNRIIVPLRFSPAATGCQVSKPAFTADGSPVLARAMQQWLTALCGGPHGFGALYDSEIGEPQAIGDTYSGLSDMALTTRPASADKDITVSPPAGRTYVYAPLAITAASVAYWLDNPATGQPYTGLKLSPRLLVKLVTTSYNFGGDGCLPTTRHASGLGCDSGVNSNPGSLYDDPEFKQLNPGVQAPPGSGGQFQVPTVQAGNYDMTWTVTRWAGADAATDAFLKGTPDTWHMHINLAYKGMTYPTDTFLSQDQYPVIARQYSPVYPPERVALYQSENWDPGTQWQKDPVTGNYPANSPEAPGARSLIAVMGNGDAAAYAFPVMAVPNAAGNYVQPTTASMTAAIQHLVSSGSGTQQVDLSSTDPAMYPMTMVVYAMVQTSGLQHSRATAIARFLDYVAGAGQRPGVGPGQLPPGYLPLTAAMRAQTQRIAARVATETAPPAPASGNGASPTTPSSTPASPSSAAAAPSSPPSAAPAPGGTLAPKATKSPLRLPSPRRSRPPAITVMTVAHPVPAMSTRFVLPVLLILGGLAAVGGTAALAAAADAPARMRRMARSPSLDPARAWAAQARAFWRNGPRAFWRKR